MAEDNWANIRVSVSIHPATRFAPNEWCLDYRVSAKAPSEAWTEAHVVAHGTHRVPADRWPPTKAAALAAVDDVVMTLRWQDPPF